MKIPQRDDQVRLDAPQTQAGRAVRPVEGSLGDSYIKTMRDMSNQFDEISKMQFKLSENAVKGQLNAFDIYVDSRTKQYNQDLQLATTKEQIDGLFAQYKKDVAENGTNILGSNLYQNWERVKGGTSIANAEYAGEVANTLLLNKQNKELAITSLDTLNIEAGNAATPKQEKEIREKAYALINSNVENATFDAATGEKLRRKFDFELDKTKIERDMDANPEATLKLLQTNDYAPAVAYPERQRFIHAAGRVKASRTGTSASSNTKTIFDLWANLYWDDNTDKDVHQKARLMAGSILDMFANHKKDAKKWVAQVTGQDEKDISYDDLNSIYSKMEATIKNQSPELTDSFEDIYKKNVEVLNSLTSIDEFYEKKENGHKKDEYKGTKVLNGKELEEAFKNGKLSKQLSNDSQFVDMFNGFNSMLNDPEMKMYITVNDAARQRVRQKMREISKLYVMGLKNPKEITEATDIYTKNLRSSMLQMIDAMEKTEANPDIMDTKLTLFVENLFSRMDVKKVFNNDLEVTSKEAEKIISNVSSALSESGIPQDYMSFFYSTSAPVEVKSTMSKFLDKTKKGVSSVYNFGTDMISSGIYYTPDTLSIVAKSLEGYPSSVKTFAQQAITDVAGGVASSVSEIPTLISDSGKAYEELSKQGKTTYGVSGDEMANFLKTMAISSSKQIGSGIENQTEGYKQTANTGMRVAKTAKKVAEKSAEKQISKRGNKK